MATKKISICNQLHIYDDAKTYSGQSSTITYATSGTIQFVPATSSAPAYLLDSANGFVTAGFDTCPELIRIVGASDISNNGSFIINRVESNKLHLERFEDVVSETTSGVVIMVELLSNAFDGYLPDILFAGAESERYALMMGI